MALLLFACSAKTHRQDESLTVYSKSLSGDGGKMQMRAALGKEMAIDAANLAGWASSPSEQQAEMGSHSGAVYDGDATVSTQVRMVNYYGNIRMQSSEPEAVIDTVVEKVKAKGGSVDNRRRGFVSLQIPVAEFKNFFNYILTLGHIIHKNISANDITEAFADNATRLRIAENALARLQELLAQAKNEYEKIALLKEIQRLSEQVEHGKLEERELLRRAAFSSINLNVSNIPTVVPFSVNIRAFEWFSALPNMYPLGKPLKLSIPKDFIEIEDSKTKWSAASALNTEFIAFETENNPQGTPDFWAKAMLEFFKFGIYKAEPKNEENTIRLQSYSQATVYYISILKSSDKKTLKIAVAKFPDLEAEQKNSEAIMEVLRREK